MRNASLKILAAVGLIATASMISSCATCIDFESQIPGTRYNVGETISEPEADIKVEQFQGANGNWTSTGHAKVDKRNFPQGTTTDINANNVNLRPKHESAEKITFKFSELGGNNNIDINGDFRNVSDLTGLNNATVGGAEITVSASQQGNNWYGAMTLEGNISEFAIGGQELWVDNYCYTPAKCETADSYMTLGMTGSIRIGQSYNEIRAVNATVLGTEDRIIDSMILSGLNLGAAGFAAVGARIYDEETRTLVASADVTAVGGNNNIAVTIPISAVLSAGKTYVIGCYIQTTPLNKASGNFFQPDIFPYVESEGVFRINSSHSASSDSFPSNPNIFVPQLVLRTKCP